jgi:hypothetical protein
MLVRHNRSESPWGNQRRIRDPQFPLSTTTPGILRALSWLYSTPTLANVVCNFGEVLADCTIDSV